MKFAFTWRSCGGRIPFKRQVKRVVRLRDSNLRIYLCIRPRVVLLLCSTTCLHRNHSQTRWELRYKQRRTSSFSSHHAIEYLPYVHKCFLLLPVWRQFLVPYLHADFQSLERPTESASWESVWISLNLVGMIFEAQLIPVFSCCALNTSPTLTQTFEKRGSCAFIAKFAIEVMSFPVDRRIARGKDYAVEQRSPNTSACCGEVVIRILHSWSTGCTRYYTGVRVITDFRLFMIIL